MATLRGDAPALPMRKVTHVRAPNGRVFVATPQLLEKPGMTPIYEDGTEVKTAHQTVDVAALIDAKGRPSHVRLPNGRVLVATDALLERGDLELLWDHDVEVPEIVNAPHPLTEEEENSNPDNTPDETGSGPDPKDDAPALAPFNHKKANKQAIQDDALLRFGVEIDMEQTAEEMRAEYEELKAAADEENGGGQNSDPDADGVVVNGDDAADDSDEQVRNGTSG